jgi:beta-glucosidase
MVKTKKTARVVAIALSLVMLSGTTYALCDSLTSHAATVDTVNGTYTSSYSSKEEAKLAGAKLNLQIAEEGMVLLKNENNALPLTAGKGTQRAKVSVFGYGAVSPAGGGSTGGDTSGGVVRVQADIYSSLRDAGFEVNPTVKAGYEDIITKASADTTDTRTMGDAKLSDQLTSTVKAAWEKSYSKYDDAAIVVFSDGTNTVGTAEGNRDHKLQLDKEQYDLLDYVTSKFDKVIVLINSSNPLEISEIKNNEKVDAILLIGEPGDNGLTAVGEILNGSVNPSGRTSDTWATDFTKDPSYVNYNISGSAYGYGNYTVDGEATDTYFVEYEEGIYVGYRYYETRGYEQYKTDSAWTWYNNAVTYTFGYGLSYTDFSWDVVKQSTLPSTLTADTTVWYDVKVTNTGDVAGKDVVQLYYSAPYTSGGIEKSHVVLGDFAKTDILKPGESQVVRVSLDLRDMASYDYSSSVQGYVLDAGDYNLTIANDAHDAAVLAAGLTSEKGKLETINLSEKMTIKTSASGGAISNQLQDVTDGYLTTSDKQLSRSDFEGTFPTAAPATRALTADEYKAWDWINDSEDETTDPWYVAEADRPTQATAASRTSDVGSVTLYDLIGKDYDDELWDTLLDELTVEEMASLIDNGGFKSINIDYIGKPESWDTDGPKGWTGTGTDSTDAFNKFAAEPVIASTFNKDLAYEMGVMIGEQGLWGNSTQASGTVYSYTGWYAPGMNTHRSPFDSRYTEYYSEDGFLTGMMAANASLGAKSMGAYVCIKHFAFHDDGGGTGFSVNADGSWSIGGYRGSMSTSRTSGLSAWFDEQTAREIYLKPFQIAVEKGEASFAMASFTRVGTTWCGGSYGVNTAILRNEWGFKGAVVTDITIYGFMYSDQMLRAGVDMQLNSGTSHLYVGVNGSTSYTDDIYTDKVDVSKLSATEISVMRNAAKHILYMVANSNAMQVPTGAKVVYNAPTYKNDDGDTLPVEVPTGKTGTAYKFEAGGATFNTFGNYLQKITYSMTGAPEGLTIDANTGVISGTPTKAGTYTVTVTASANYYESSSVEYTIVVADANAPVYVTGSDVQGMIDSSIAGKTSTDDVNKIVDEAIAKNNESQNSGCGSAISTSLICGLAVVFVGIGVVVALRKKKDND